MNDWQPIETAPKDGTLVLLWDPTATIDAPWNGDDGPAPGPYVGFWKRESYWQLAHYSAYSHEPTHWMPLPPPPKAPK